MADRLDVDLEVAVYHDTPAQAWALDRLHELGHAYLHGDLDGINAVLDEIAIVPDLARSDNPEKHHELLRELTLIRMCNLAVAAGRMLACVTSREIPEIDPCRCLAAARHEVDEHG